jgi:hypothetical protein
MKYSVVHGLTHPRMSEDLSDKNITFYDIGNDKSSVILLQNLMKDILNPNLSRNIRHVMEDFFESRTICVEGENKIVKKILEFFDVYEKRYINKSGLNFYLVKRKDNQILDVINCWKSERESKRAYAKSKRNRKDD